MLKSARWPRNMFEPPVSGRPMPFVVLDLAAQRRDVPTDLHMAPNNFPPGPRQYREKRRYLSRLFLSARSPFLHRDFSWVSSVQSSSAVERANLVGGGRARARGRLARRQMEPLGSAATSESSSELRGRGNGSEASGIAARSERASGELVMREGGELVGGGRALGARSGCSGDEDAWRRCLGRVPEVIFYVQISTWNMWFVMV
jgi:hypothetical protein